MWSNIIARVRLAADRTSAETSLAYTSKKGFNLQQEQLFKSCELPLDVELEAIRDRVLVDRSHDDWKLTNSKKDGVKNRIFTEDSHHRFGTVYLIVDAQYFERTGFRVKGRFVCGDGIIPAQMSRPEALGIWTMVQLREKLLQRYERKFHRGGFDDLVANPLLWEVSLTNGVTYKDLVVKDPTIELRDSNIRYLISEASVGYRSVYTFGVYGRIPPELALPELVQEMEGQSGREGLGFRAHLVKSATGRWVHQLAERTKAGTIAYFAFRNEVSSHRVLPLFDSLQSF